MTEWKTAYGALIDAMIYLSVALNQCDEGLFKPDQMI